MVLELASGFNSWPMLILITFWATLLSIYKTLLCTIMYRLALRVVIYGTYAMNHTISYVLLSVQKALDINLKQIMVVIHWHVQWGLSI